MTTIEPLLGYNPDRARSLLPLFDALPTTWRDLPPVFGGGRVIRPAIALVFMNPTIRNQSVVGSWSAGRSPFIGLSRVWRFLAQCGLLASRDVSDLPPDGSWSETFAMTFYARVANRGLYVTNLVKATATDSTNPSVALAKAFRPATVAELIEIKPEVIVTMGALVSSVLLEREVRFKDWFAGETTGAALRIGRAVAETDVVPCYYPIGRGNPSGARRVLSTLVSNG